MTMRSRFRSTLLVLAVLAPASPPLATPAVATPAPTVAPLAAPTGGDGDGLPFVQVATILEQDDDVTVDALATGDWDDDGDQDAAAVVTGDGTFDLVVLEQDAGVLAETARLTAPAAWNVTSRASLVATDVDGDDRPDLVAGSERVHALLVHLGDGDGGFATGVSYPLDHAAYPDATDNDPIDLAVAQLDDDARAELVVRAEHVGSDPQPLFTVDFSSDGSAMTTHVLELPSTFTSPGDVAVADLDGDDEDEVLVVERSGGRPQLVLDADGAGGLAAPASTECGAQPSRNACVGGFWPPNAIQLGDFEGDDGDLDVAMGGQDEVHLGINDGTGAFTFSTVAIPGGGSLADLNVDPGPHDVDADDRDDLVLANARGSGYATGDQVVVGRGNDDGTFDVTRHVAFPSPDTDDGVAPTRVDPKGVGSVAVADLTDDGRLDVLTGVASGRVAVGLLIGDADAAGGFRAPEIVSEPGIGGGVNGSRDATALVDLDEDGRDDVIALDDAAFVTLRASPQGSFEPPVLVAGATNCSEFLDAGDVDGDGHVDAVCLGGGVTGSGYVAYGDGAGALGDIHAFSSASGAGDGRPEYRDLVVADVDHDGRAEIVTSYLDDRPTGDANEVHVVHDDGSRVLTGSTVIDLDGEPTNASRYAVEVADVTGDGNPDVVAAFLSDQNLSQNDTLVATAPGRGDGTFGAPRIQRLERDLAPFDIEAGDVDEDGRDDLAFITTRGERAGVLLSNGDGSYADDRTTVVTRQSGGADVELLDVDGDGHLDLLSTNATNQAFDRLAIEISLGHGDGTFEPRQFLTNGHQRAGDVLGGDIDGDGVVDLVTTWGELTVHLGTGDPVVQWTGPFHDWWHDTETMAFAAPAGASVTASVTPSGGGSATPMVVTDGTASLDTTGLADGDYDVELRVDDGTVTTDTRSVRVRNDGVSWHDGPVGDATWAADTVHVVRSHVDVMAGSTLTVAEGAVVKFASGASLGVEDGASVDAGDGAVLTTIEDDAHGGDTDGVLASPADGSWNGVADVAGLPVDLGLAVDVRHEAWRHRGPLDDDATVAWTDEQLHVVDTNTGAIGQDEDAVELRLLAGAVVKLTTATWVQTYGDLVVRGTPTAPVVITSWFDDAVGGDSDGDGGARPAAAGDWLFISSRRVTDVAGAVVRYGSGPYSTTNLGVYGQLHVLAYEPGASTRIADSVFSDAGSAGLNVSGGGMARVTNVVVTRTADGIANQTPMTITNATIHDNGTGITNSYGTSGNPVTLVNSTITDYDRAFRARLGGVRVDTTWSNLWSDRTGATTGGCCFSVGSDGNVAVDPLFVGTTGPDAFELRPTSPLVDAASGPDAPATDLRGRIRVDEPLVDDTGVAAEDGTVPDIGALEYTELDRDLPDIDITEVRAPLTLAPGATVDVDWTVRNVGDEALGQDWEAEVVLVGEGVQASGTTAARFTPELPDRELAPGASTTVTSPFRVPAVLPGTYRIQVTGDADDVVWEASESDPLAVQPSAGNRAASDPASVVQVTELVRDGSSETAPADTATWFRVAAGGPFDVRTSGPADLRIATGRLPTRADSDADATGASTLRWATPTTEVAFVRVASSGADVDVQVITPPPSIDEVRPGRTYAGHVELDVTGAFLHEVTGAVLRRGASEVVADDVEVDGNRVAVGAEVTSAGTWDLVLETPSTEVVAPGALQVEPAPTLGVGPAGQLAVAVEAPAAMRRGRTSIVQLTYANVGDGPLALPAIRVEASTGALSLWGSEPSPRLDLVVPAVSSRPFLLPGETGSIPLTFHSPDAQVTATFSAWGASASDPDFGDEAIDWDAIGAAARPSGVSDARWAQVVAQARDTWGTTQREQAEELGRRYEDLRRLGMRTPVFLDGRWHGPPQPGDPGTGRIRGNALVEPGTIAPLAQAPSTRTTARQADERPLQDGSGGTTATPQQCTVPPGTTATTPPNGGTPRAGDGVETVVVVLIASNTQGGAGLAALPGARRDQQQLERTFRGSVGLPETRVITLTDQSEATILSQIGAAGATLDADDQLLVFNSSHGTVNGDGTGAAVYTADGSQITPSEMAGSWSNTSAHVTFVTDSCHSNYFVEDLKKSDTDVTGMGSGWGPVDDGGHLINGITGALDGNPDVDITSIVTGDEQRIRSKLQSLGLSDSSIDDVLQGRVKLRDVPEIKDNADDYKDIPPEHRGSWAAQKARAYEIMGPEGQELQDLFKVPSDDRTPEQKARISELQVEFDQAREQQKAETEQYFVDNPDAAATRDRYRDVQGLRDTASGRSDPTDPFHLVGGEGGVVLRPTDTDDELSDESGDETQECPVDAPEECSGGSGTRGPDSTDETEVLTSYDPNDKTAMAGAWARPDEPLPYLVRFENDADADVPAQEVVVTDVLDADLDLASLELDEIRFGDVLVPIPAGRSQWSGRVTAQVAGRTETVDIDVTLETASRTLTWRLTSVDPLTDTFPDDPFAGFLPPNDDTGVGEGSLSYRVRPLPATPSGTEVTNTASIVFDTNDPITTNTVTTTIDADRPTVTMTGADRTSTTPTATVRWDGADPTSAIAAYDVWVSVDGAAWRRWLHGTSASSATWTAPGDQSVRFVARAADAAGNVDAREDAPELTVVFDLPGSEPPTTDDPDDPSDDPGTDPTSTTATFDRLSGATRVDTSVLVSQRVFPDGSDQVVVATADAFPDALAGAPLAAQLDAPMLLTSGTSLSPVVAAEIARLGATRAVLLGGTAALSREVEEAVAAQVGDVRRIAGADRFATAAQVADRLDHPRRAYVVEGRNPSPSRGWPDAVSVAGLAAFEGSAILLVETDQAPIATVAALSSLHIEDVRVVGGTAAVSEAVAQAVGADGRISGPDRYATNAAVVTFGLARGLRMTTTWVATGRNFPDALAIGPAVARDGGVLVLVDSDDLAASPAARDLLAAHADEVEHLVVAGGTGAVSDLVARQLRALLP